MTENDFNDFINETLAIDRVHIGEIRLEKPFLEMAADFAGLEGTVVLASGGKSDCARFDILGAMPLLEFKCRGDRAVLKTADRILNFSADPFDVLRSLSETCKVDAGNWELPVISGLLGYLAYDLKDFIEELPKTSVDDLRLPGICLYAHRLLVIHDRASGSAFLCIPLANGEPPDEIIKRFYDMAGGNAGTRRGFALGGPGFASGIPKAYYMDSVNRILDYIVAGDVYQVNFSQRFEADFKGDPYALFTELFKKNPAPFFAYVNAGDHHIVSTSPERFVLRKGRSLETRPIKGTAPRSTDPALDAAMRKTLLESAKNDAELSMIVDLLRNDFGKVSEAETVMVKSHKRVERYENVWHMVSDVTGTLREGLSSVDVIKAAFPGGSITGCPKIRAMEIIDELEPSRRHVYTGSIGYISFHDTMDLSVAIRTATILNGKILFSAGGGIVSDSDPSDEFEETMHKGRTLMEVFKGRTDAAPPKRFAWADGRLAEEGEAVISIGEPGFQYGFGFFETIRAENGTPAYLREHTERFRRAWKAIFDSNPPDVDWDGVVSETLEKNSLLNRIAKVKIIAVKRKREKPPGTHAMFVTADPYVHRLFNKKETGLAAAVFPEPRQTPLADHKTLNYLFYLLAGKRAGELGCDEALILNPDGSVSETDTAGIIAIRDKKAVLPVSGHVLPGIMQKQACRVLKDMGYDIRSGKLYAEDLLKADEALLTNSLMGAVPLLSVDGQKLRPPSDIWRKINARVLRGEVP